MFMAIAVQNKSYAGHTFRSSSKSYHTRHHQTERNAILSASSVLAALIYIDNEYMMLSDADLQ